MYYYDADGIPLSVGPGDVSLRPPTTTLMSVWHRLDGRARTVAIADNIVRSGEPGRLPNAECFRGSRPLGKATKSWIAGLVAHPGHVLDDQDGRLVCLVVAN